MDHTNESNRFPEQHEPSKVHGTTDESAQKEKYIRDAGKIEDYPSQDELPKMSTNVNSPKKNESSHLTDRSGEEKKEDYINTDERKKDLDRRGL
jgi:hypothetical protein